MTMYHVRGISEYGNDNNVGELAKTAFDIMGHAVVDEDEFRVFTSKDGTYPIGFRADTREPSVIFRDGFRRRRNADAKYPPAGKESPIPGLQRPTVAIRLGNIDMDTDCAVCVTRNFAIAALFPFDPKRSFGTRTGNIYICRMKHWLQLYSVQERLAPHLAYAKEVASLGIAPADIIGCIHVLAYWRSDGVSFSYTKSVRNSDYEDILGAQQIMSELQKNCPGNSASDSAPTVGAPPPQVAKAYGIASGPQVFEAVKRTLESLRGDDRTNEVTRGAIHELAFAPSAQAQQPQARRRNSLDLGKGSSKSDF